MMTKKEFRAAALARRQAIPAEKKREFDRQICQRIAALDAFRRADCVLLYAAIKGEIDLSPLIALCRRSGKAVAFPVCDRESGEMHFRILSENATLTPGAFGIPEPPSDAPDCEITEASVCILLGLSFDARGNRMGYGKGFYDKFLQTHSLIKIGAIYEELTVKQIPTEPHDLPADLLVTERGVIDCVHQRARATAKEPSAASGTVSDRILAFFKNLKNPLTPLHTTAETDGASAPPLRCKQAPLWLVLIILCLLTVYRLIDPLITHPVLQYLFVPLTQLLIFIGSAAVYFKICHSPNRSALRLQLPRLSQLWFCFCVLAVMVCGSLLISIATGGIESLGGNFTLYNTFVARINGSVWETVYVIVAYAVLPAICEEFVFRSLICAEYEGGGIGISLLTSSLLFAMLHTSFPLFPNYLFLGLLLAGVAYATRSVLASILLHGLYNVFCLFGQPYLSAFYVNAGSGEIFVFCLVVLLLLFAAFASGEARKIYHLYARANLSSAYTASVTLRNYPKRIFLTLRQPAFVILFALWIALSILNLIL